MTKKELRLRVKTEIAAIDIAERRRSALAVAEAVESIPEFKAAKNVMLYASLPDELPTDVMISRWKGEKHIFLPRVEGKDIVVVPYVEEMLAVGAFGIKEPKDVEAVSAEVIDFVVVPGRVFDKEGLRIGRGKGYYDRFFAQFSADRRPYAVGVGFSCQMTDDLSGVAEPHDFVLDKVLV